MFVVEPYQRLSKIRSPLGFMSLATNWGNLLFPGITVLTRDFLHLELLLREYRRARRKGRSDNDAKRFLAKRSTHERLEREVHRIRRTKRDYTQMGYWQRYGSMFEYFRLENSPRNLSSDQLASLVFGTRAFRASFPWCPEDTKKRNRRLDHTYWFDRIYRQIIIPSQGKPNLISSSNAWWLTGKDFPGEIPVSLKLCRQLEFAFLIWQTFFEICVWLRTSGEDFPQRAPSEPVSALDALRAIYELEQSQAEKRFPSKKTLFTTARLLLGVHDQILPSHLNRWEAKVTSQYADPDLLRLYDGKTPAKLAEIKPGQLFPALWKLHKYYCDAQGKQHALYLEQRGSKYIPRTIPPLTAEFSTGRWGLFGYRMQVALTLRSSVERS